MTKRRWTKGRPCRSAAHDLGEAEDDEFDVCDYQIGFDVKVEGKQHHDNRHKPRS